MLDTLLNALPLSWRPFAKFIYPAVASVVATLVLWVVEGHLNANQMEVALVGLLASLVAFLVKNMPDGMQRYAKALVPALLTCAGVAVHLLVTGDWDTDAWRIALAGLGSAAITLLIPNAPAVVVAAPATSGAATSGARYD